MTQKAKQSETTAETVSVSLSTPAVTADGETWYYLWADHGMAIGFELLREKSDGLHGELWIAGEPGQNGHAPHIIWGAFNLSSPTARARMATVLGSRKGGKHVSIPLWIEALEYACIRTAQDFRRGEPILDLANAQVATDIDYLLYPLAPRGEVTSLFADGESGKSILALALAISLRLPAEVVPGIRPNGQAKTLYLDWETSYHENARRQELICRGLGLHSRPSGILYRHMSRPLADDLPPIRSAIDKEKIEFVVIDSAGPATGAELKESDPVIRFMSALRVLNATKLVLGHVSKETAKQHGSDRGRMFGSVFFENLSRACWEVRSDAECTPMQLGFFHRKANMGPRTKPFSVCLCFNDQAHTATFRSANLEDSPTIAEHAPLSMRMAAALRHGHRSTTELAEDLGVSVATIRSVGRREVAKGALVQLHHKDDQGGRGATSRWGLAATMEGAR